MRLLCKSVLTGSNQLGGGEFRYVREILESDWFSWNRPSHLWRKLLRKPSGGSQFLSSPLSRKVVLQIVS